MHKQEDSFSNDQSHEAFLAAIHWGESIFYYAANWLTSVQTLTMWAKPERNCISFYWKKFCENAWWLFSFNKSRVFYKYGENDH